MTSEEYKCALRGACADNARITADMEIIEKTHRRSLQIIEEKRSQISKMELEIEELSRIEGQMECLQRAHVIGLQVLEDKYREISDLKKENEDIGKHISDTWRVAKENADLKKQIAELKGEK